MFTLRSGTTVLTLPYKVLGHFIFEEKVIVWFDPWRGPKYKSEIFENIRCYTHDGSEVWRAELPVRIPTGCYYNMDPGDPIEASTLSSHDCKIDPRTGKILEKTFFK